MLPGRDQPSVADPAAYERPGTGLPPRPARKHRLLNGLVDRSLSLQLASEAAHVAPTQTSQPPQVPGRFTGEKTSDVLRCERGMT